MKKVLTISLISAVLIFSFGYTEVSFADKHIVSPNDDNKVTSPNDDFRVTNPEENKETGARAIRNPIKVNSIQDFIAEILKFIVKIGVPIVAFFIILSGFNFVTAQGNERQLETAKRGILYTVIGGILLLGAWGLAQVIGDTVDKIVN
jgi:hypothetical protein